MLCSTYTCRMTCFYNEYSLILQIRDALVGELFDIFHPQKPALIFIYLFSDKV